MRYFDSIPKPEDPNQVSGRRCTNCQGVKSLPEFYAYPSGKLARWCRACMSDATLRTRERKRPGYALCLVLNSWQCDVEAELRPPSVGLQCQWPPSLTAYA